MPQTSFNMATSHRHCRRLNFNLSSGQISCDSLHATMLMTRVFVAWLLMQRFEVRALSRNPHWCSTFAFVTTCPICANDFAGSVWCETPNAATVMATLASSSFSNAFKCSW